MILLAHLLCASPTKWDGMYTLHIFTCIHVIMTDTHTHSFYPLKIVGFAGTTLLSNTNKETVYKLYVLVKNKFNFSPELITRKYIASFCAFSFNKVTHCGAIGHCENNGIFNEPPEAVCPVLQRALNSNNWHRVGAGRDTQTSYSPVH